MLDATSSPKAGHTDPSADALRRKLSASASSDGLGARLLGVAKDHPVATGLAVGGLAWLYLSTRSSGDAAAKPALAGSRYEAMTRWADDGGPPPPEHDLEEQWRRAADHASDTLRDGLSALEHSERSGANTAAEIARQRAELMASHARSTAEAFRTGLSHMSQAAQERISSARRRAYEAGSTAAAQVKKPESLSLTTFLAGLVLSYLLPLSNWERKTMVDSRARLFAEARRALGEYLLKDQPRSL
jgi:hypothetical protein